MNVILGRRRGVYNIKSQTTTPKKEREILRETGAVELLRSSSSKQRKRQKRDSSPMRAYPSEFDGAPHSVCSFFVVLHKHTNACAQRISATHHKKQRRRHRRRRRRCPLLCVNSHPHSPRLERGALARLISVCCHLAGCWGPTGALGIDGRPGD